ncbi:MAG: efflux RND transporter periplasmic adaptor subunit [Rhodothalassiaceae bacterium]
MDDRAVLLQSLKIDRSEPEPTRRGWLWIGLAALVLAGGVGGFFLLDRPDRATTAQEAPANAPAAASAPAQAASGSAQGSTPASAPASAPGSAPAAADGRVLNASGYIVARRRATVSAEITGRVETLMIEEGQRVARGDVLARLDPALAQVDLALAEARVQSAQAVLLAAQANFAESERVLRRITDLSDKDFSSQADLTRSQAEKAAREAELARAQADLAVARLQVDLSRERLEDHTIRAPFGGVVIDKNAQEGEIIAPGSAGGGFTRTGICTLVDMDSLEIEVDVNEAYINRVFEGQRVSAQLDAYPDWAIGAQVIAIVPTANRDKATVRVRIGIDEPDPRILPDMGVNVAFLES